VLTGQLGAFGFLAGPTVEKNAVANVGLHDQLAALQWVQDYIYSLGGNKNKVTAMGDSAGKLSSIFTTTLDRSN